VNNKQTETLSARVYAHGFNIYKLLNRFKKERHIDLPEPVIQKVCTYYIENTAKIKNHYAWFIISVRRASEDYFAKEEIKRGQEWKKQPIAKSLKQIMREAGK